MFKKKEDPTELELLMIRVRNLEKQIAELKKAPQVQAEELKDADHSTLGRTLSEIISDLSYRVERLERS